MLTLYFAPGSSSMAAHIALHEAGAEFESRPLSFHKKEQRAPAFLALNPEGKVPTLVVDGKPLTEVAAILFYIARRFPEAALLPPGLEAEAQALSWMTFLASTVHPARRMGGLDRLREIYGIVEKRFGPGEWVLGDFSVVDIYLFRLFWRVSNSEPMERGEFPTIAAHYERMMRRPAVRRTIEIETAIGYELP